MPIRFQQTDEVTPSVNDSAIWYAYESFSRRTLTALSVWLFSVLATATAASVFMPIKSIAAVTPSETVDNTPAVGVSLSDIDFGGISPNVNGVVRTVGNTATVNSSIYGYELYISSADNDTNALIRSGTAGTSPSEIIPASSATDITAPAVLGKDSWGFAVQRRNTTANSGSEDVLSTAAFDNTYPTGDNSSANSKFAAVPTLGNKVLIAERSTSATDVPTNIYYGINVSTSTPSGLYQGTVTYTAVGKAPTTHTVTVKLVPGISSVTLGGDVCNSSNATDSTDVNDPVGTKYCEMTLTYGYTYDLTATAERNYGFDTWSTNNGIGTFGNANAATTTFTAGQGNTTIIPSAVKTAVDITLNQNGATTNGSTTTIATIGQTTLGTITNPARSYSVSGFDTSYNNAADATVTFQTTGDCTDATNCSSNYTFDGWYEESAQTNKIASNATTPVLQANTSYTNVDSEWTSTSDQTLYAGWTSQAVALPTITKTGYTCGWSTGTNTIAIMYESGGTFIPTADTVLHGACVAYIQDLTSEACQSVASASNFVAIDRRDNKEYTVRYIDGNCWMTQNLRITGSTALGDAEGTIRATDSNFTGNSVTFDGDLISGDSYNNAYYHDSGNVASGAWYNYAAATAKTIVGNANSTNATQDICPKNWRLLTNDEIVALKDAVGSSPSAFSPVVGGYYQSGSLLRDNYAGWWSSTASTDVNRYGLYYNGNGLDTGYDDRYLGLYVRCIQSSAYEITFDGDANVSGFVVNGENVAKGGSVSLRAGLTYDVMINYAEGYEASNTPLQKNSGEGTVSGTSFTVGRGVATLYANSRVNVPYIQDFTNEMCQAQASSGNVTVRDRRDNNEYMVRYINGNCWMTSNLRITGTVSATDSNFVGNDVNVSEGDLTDGDSYDQPRTHVGVDEDNNPTVWYNYAAATAKTITGDSNSNDATQDVCPSSWRLPTNSEQLGIVSYKDAYGPVLGGYYLSGSIGNAGGGGLWWSTTVVNDTNRYSLSYNGSILSADGDNRVFGFYVRCIRRNDVSNAIYMQDVTSAMVDDIAEGATFTLKDKRDEKEYTVTKQADGNLWMTQNLRLGGPSAIKLTVDNTDLVSTSVYDSGSDGWYTPAVQTSGSDSWESSVDAKHIYQQGDTNYGNLYNWYTATAGTGTSNMTNSDASSSICPKGWKLPPNTGTGSYTELMQATVDSSMASSGYNTTYTNAFQATPLSFVLSGDYLSELRNQGTYGVYWSRTAYSSSNLARNFYFDGSSGYYDLQSYGGEYYGYAVRCVRVS